MLLHGHTRETIDGLPWRDYRSVVAHCRLSIIGPLSSHVQIFRLTTYIRELHRTLTSIFGTPGQSMELTDWPELAAYARRTDAGLPKDFRVKGERGINEFMLSLHKRRLGID